MENSQQQILSEIKFLMASVRHQLEELDVKIAQWQQMAEPDEVIDVVSDIDLGLDDIPLSFDAEPVVEPEPEPVSEPEAEPESVLEPEPVLEPEQPEVPMSEPVIEPDPVVEDVVEETVFDLPVEDSEMSEVDDDLPFFDLPQEVTEPKPPVQESAPVLNDLLASEESHAVIDVMTHHHAWRTAMPGAPVKDIRGAIALMDRVLFINNLFGTDPMAFQDTLSRINQMETLDQAVEYLAAAHPEWDFDSDIVYSFMMAVRRKVNS